MIWWIVPAAVGFFGLVVTLAGFSHMGKRKAMSGGVRFIGGVLVLSAAALVTMVGINLQTYSRLNQERHVADIELERVDDQHFRAEVTLDGETTPTDYVIRGDEVLFESSQRFFGKVGAVIVRRCELEFDIVVAHENSEGLWTFIV